MRARRSAFRPPLRPLGRLTFLWPQPLFRGRGIHKLSRSRDDWVRSARRIGGGAHHADAFYAGGVMRREYAFEERYQRACLRAAMNIRGLWEEKGSSDTRLIEGLLLPDEFTVVGQSHAFDTKGRREHVIPRLVVIKEVHDMLERGATDAQIAAFIRDHVKIVRISDEECLRLDRKDQLDLRQRMPMGWAFGDDIYARLSAADIAWTPSPGSNAPPEGGL